MSPEWDIVSTSPDIAAIKAVARMLCASDDGRGLPESSLLTPEFRFIKGQSFRARLGAIPEGWHSERSGVQWRLEFAPATGPWPKRPWRLWARGDDADRTDRISGRVAKVLRRALAPSRVQQERWGSSWTRTGHLWVPLQPADNDVDEVAAQIAVFLLQSSVLRGPGRAVVELWLHRYLKTMFRLTLDEAEQLEQEAHRYVRPERAHSLRAYLRMCLPWIRDRRERRQVRSMNVDALLVRRSSPEGVDRENVDGEGVWKSSRRRVTRVDHSQDADALTIDEAARHLGLCRSTVYEMIRDGRIAAVPITGSRGGFRLWIRESELERARAHVRPKPKDVIALVCNLLQKSPATARKWVQRQRAKGFTLQDIAERLLDARPRFVESVQPGNAPLQEPCAHSPTAGFPEAAKPTAVTRKKPRRRKPRLVVGGGFAVPPTDAPCEVSQPLQPDLIAKQLARARVNERKLRPLHFEPEALD